MAALLQIAFGVRELRKETAEIEAHPGEAFGHPHGLTIRVVSTLMRSVASRPSSVSGISRAISR